MPIAITKPKPTIAVQARMPVDEYNALTSAAGPRGVTVFIREAVAEKVASEKKNRKGVAR
jgi:hypothetical protein